jgi:hypothetical protein
MYAKCTQCGHREDIGRPRDLFYKSHVLMEPCVHCGAAPGYLERRTPWTESDAFGYLIVAVIVLLVIGWITGWGDGAASSYTTDDEYLEWQDAVGPPRGY